jgi:hypothetical protein
VVGSVLGMQQMGLPESNVSQWGVSLSDALQVVGMDVNQRENMGILMDAQLYSCRARSGNCPWSVTIREWP